jgi:hypothetical protein
MSLRSALVDRAYQRRQAADTKKVEGRTLRVTTESPPIRARLEVNPATERADEGGRVTTEPRPRLMTHHRDEDGNVVEFSNSDRLRVVSKELGEHIWEIDGEPDPIRKKRRVIGWELNLHRVEEGV